MDLKGIFVIFKRMENTMDLNQTRYTKIILYEKSEFFMWNK